LKVLFLHSGKVDYLQDVVYSGLVRILGRGNVLSYRWSKWYHLPIYKHPKNIGYDHFEFPRCAIKKGELSQFTHIIIGSCKEATFQDFLEVQRYLRGDAKIVFIDGGDDSDIGGDLKREGADQLFLDSISSRPFDFIFKREMLLRKSYPPNTFPLSFAVDFGKFEAKALPKRFDVVFWAVESHPIRKEVLQALDGEFDCRVNGSVPNQTLRNYRRKGADYLRGIMESRITLNYRGAGWDTLRYWEVTSLGQFLISQKPEIKITNNFEHEKSIVFVGSDPAEMLDRCKYYLRNAAEADTIGQRAAEHSRLYHTPEARARFILETIA